MRCAPGTVELSMLEKPNGAINSDCLICATGVSRTRAGSTGSIERFGSALQPRSSTPWMTHAPPPSSRRFACPPDARRSQRAHWRGCCLVARRPDGAAVCGVVEPGADADRWRHRRGHLGEGRAPVAHRQACQQPFQQSSALGKTSRRAWIDLSLPFHRAAMRGRRVTARRSRTRRRAVTCP